jgi:ubiquinone/menaquinone biosynthesis C-methylase UbiE
MSDSTQKNQIGYDLWAKQYDQELNSTIAVDEEHFSSHWNHLRNQRVLEIGCGTGRNTKRLIAQENDVTALEISSGMLAVAKEKLQPDAVRFIEADFMTTPLLDGEQYAGILTSLVLEHIGNLPVFFKRVNRLLTPNGEFFLSEIHPARIAKGTQANFTDPTTGENIRLVSYAHSSEEVLSASKEAGLTLITEKEVFGDESLTKKNPAWLKHLGQPMIKIWVFRK